MRVLVFGDSITAGFYDDKGGWVDRLKQHYLDLTIKHPEQSFPSIYNLGVSGDLASNILKRFENEVEARVWPDEEFSFIFSVGVNDSGVEDDEPKSTPERYREDLEVLITAAKKHAKSIIFVGLTPVDEKYTTPVSWINMHYTNERIFLFENVMRDEAIKHEVKHIHILEPLQDKMITGEKLMSDGLHPNTKGHQMIFEIIRPILDETWLDGAVT